MGGVSLASANALDLQLVSQFNMGVGAGEVVSYADGVLAVTNNPVGGVSVWDFGSSLTFDNQRDADFSSFNFNDVNFTYSGVTSVAIDSRGFGVVALENGIDTNVGKIGLFDTGTGSVLGAFNVGFLPDMVAISGNRVLVANEGEWDDSRPGDSDLPGSVSIFDLGSTSSASDVMANISSTALTDLNGAPGLSGIRIHDSSYTAGQEYRNPEPEYITVAGDRAFVALQESSAIGVYNLNTNQWETLEDLGIHEVTIDASNRDAGAVIDDTVNALVMPDAIVSFESGGNTYIAVTSEGDARGDDGDIERGNGFSGVDSDPAPAGNLTTDLDNETGIGRLHLVTDLSDPDGDGLLNDVVSLSTRSIHIFLVDDATGELTEVGDTGPLEAFLLAQDPTRHNANDGGDPGEFDGRSDDKGPELEAIDHLVIDGEDYLVVGAERQGGVILINASDLAAPVAEGYINGQPDGLISPETLQAVIIDGKEYVIVGFEGDGEAVAGGIGVYAAIPEPAAMGGMLGLFALLLARRRS